MEEQQLAERTLRRYVDDLVALEERIVKTIHPETEYDGDAYDDAIHGDEESPLHEPLSARYVYEAPADKLKEIGCVALEYLVEYGGPGVVIRFERSTARVTVTTMGVEIFHTLSLSATCDYIAYLIDEAEAEIRATIRVGS